MNVCLKAYELFGAVLYWKMTELLFGIKLTFSRMHKFLYFPSDRRRSLSALKCSSIVDSYHGKEL